MTPIPTDPVRRPVALQNWNLLTFVHWSYAPAVIQKMLPPGLVPDLFGGRAWVGLIPFLLEGLRPPFLPPFLWLPNYPETNLRTYVKAQDGSSGVFFFSLDTDSLLGLVVGRALYRMNYVYSDMSVVPNGQSIRYQSRRRWPTNSRGAARISVEIGEPYGPGAAGDIAEFLTCRWRLFTVRSGGLYWAGVYHEPWPLYRARLLELDQTLLNAANLPDPEEDPLVMYSPGVHSRVSLPHALV